MLLYPYHTGLGADALDASYAMMEGDERLRIATVNLVTGKEGVQQQLARLIGPVSTASEVSA